MLFLYPLALSYIRHQVCLANENHLDRRHNARRVSTVVQRGLLLDEPVRVCINSYSGVSNSDARNSQSPSVEDAIVTPDRASWPARRCTGV